MVKIMDTISTSTIKVEYLALSTVTRDLIPIRHLDLKLGNKLGIDKLDITEICYVHEDNQGCFKLAQLELVCMTPNPKFMESNITDLDHI